MKEKELSWWEKAKERIKGGDAARMRSFQRENISELDMQITIRTAEKTDLETQIEEADDNFIEASLDVDTTKIGSNIERKEYIKVFNKKLSDILNNQGKLRAELKAKNTEIERFERIRNMLQKTYTKEE